MVSASAEEPAAEATQAGLSAEPKATSSDDAATPISLDAIAYDAVAPSIPLWPIVGICLGFAALAGVVAWSRRRQGGER
jgi:hypothetical protein